MTSRPFMDLLREQRSGLAHEELTEGLQELVEAVVSERKAGKLVLTMTVKPNGDGTVMVTDDVKVTAPKPTRGSSLFFVTPENNLQRQDPKQQSLPLREIGAAEAPRELGPASAGRTMA